ncbi:hypothetical protein SAMN05444339_105190 [Loktanella atrilutea]|uniref:Uncharacterized protein n=1 Tax=Loktanella atrilutea TaxID=366533 RepID=A0A1M5B1C5_LOKAT|nr:hypothetical protein [Loktanella atrilutea]SHF36263.1 hypothetical protein SAMN05444339_105190 [Loktanella atrilutea]
MKYIFLALIMLCGSVSGAAAQSCGPNDHYLTAEINGFVPNDMYYCAGQQIFVTNNTTTDLYFYYKPMSSNSYKLSEVIRSGRTSGPFKDFNAGDVYVARRSGDNYYYYHGSGVKARLIQGTAPDSY